jgi:hypothetical protein
VTEPGAGKATAIARAVATARIDAIKAASR